jgi:hypothetical protein
MPHVIKIPESGALFEGFQNLSSLMAEFLPDPQPFAVVQGFSPALSQTATRSSGL